MNCHCDFLIIESNLSFSHSYWSHVVSFVTTILVRTRNNTA